MYKKTGTNSPDIMLFIKNLIILENPGDFSWVCLHSEHLLISAKF